MGRLSALETRGIAGVADFRRIKCLHAMLAHHLARGNALGTWIRRRIGPEPLAPGAH